MSKTNPQNPEIQEFCASVKALRSEYEKGSKVVEFVKGIEGQNEKISAVIQILNSGSYLTKFNAKAISELIREGEIEQERIIDFCQIFFEEKEEPLKLSFLNTCLWHKIINDFEVFKEIAIGFSDDIFNSLLKSPNMYVAQLNLTQEQKQEIIERDERSRLSQDSQAASASRFVPETSVEPQDSESLASGTFMDFKFA